MTTYAQDRSRDPPLWTFTARPRSPGQQLADEASVAVALMVVGSRGYGPMQRVLLGSVSTSLMHSAPCPVMVVPRTAEFDPSGEGQAGEDQYVASA
ncbi:MAG: universal stress protein [Thermoleophilaceae bacterium]